jgi:hypothetical protein
MADSSECPGSSSLPTFSQPACLQNPKSAVRRRRLLFLENNLVSDNIRKNYVESRVIYFHNDHRIFITKAPFVLYDILG